MVCKAKEKKKRFPYAIFWVVMVLSVLALVAYCGNRKTAEANYHYRAKGVYTENETFFNEFADTCLGIEQIDRMEFEISSVFSAPDGGYGYPHIIDKFEGRIISSSDIMTPELHDYLSKCFKFLRSCGVKRIYLANNLKAYTWDYVNDKELQYTYGTIEFTIGSGMHPSELIYYTEPNLPEEVTTQNLHDFAMLRINDHWVVRYYD